MAGANVGLFYHTTTEARKNKIVQCNTRGHLLEQGTFSRASAVIVVSNRQRKSRRKRRFVSVRPTSAVPLLNHGSVAQEAYQGGMRMSPLERY